MAHESRQWSTTPDEWRTAFQTELGVDPSDAVAKHARGELAPEPFLDWIQTEFAEEHGYHPDFAPALTRNIRGLIAWTYGTGPEPHWPSTDASQS